MGYGAGGFGAFAGRTGEDCWRGLNILSHEFGMKGNIFMQSRIVFIILIIFAVTAGILSSPTYSADQKNNKSEPKSNRGLNVVRKGDGRRIALVIGNGNYQYTGQLANTANDARLMAETLKEVGFELYGGKPQINLSRDDMINVIEGFGDSIGSNDTALFYYSGHGMQVKGENYLIPINASIKNEAEVRVKSVESSLIFAKLEGTKNGINIVILDACRNNPFGRSFRSGNNGLAQVTAPSGTIVAFSTAPNQVAEDGSNGNSTYTRELARFIKLPGLQIEDVFKRVRVAVEEATGGNQLPWENTSLKGDFSFVNAELANIKDPTEKISQVTGRERNKLQKQLPASSDAYEFEKDSMIFYRDWVLDTRTDLIWARNGNIRGKYLDWNSALNWVKSLKIGGYRNWRLPTKDELESFIGHEGGQTNTMFNAKGFSNVQGSFYWSSSSAPKCDCAWGINLGFYKQDREEKSGYGYVWPVRNRQ